MADTGNPLMDSGVGSNAITQITDGFITAQNFFQALKAEERDTHLMSPYGNNRIHTYLESMGLQKKVGNIEYTHAEDTQSTESYSLSLNIAGGAGAVVTVSVEAKSQFEYNRSFYGDTNPVESIMPRLQEVLVFPGGIEGMVMSVDSSAKTITAMPTQTGEKIPITIASDKVVSIGIYGQEGGGSPEPWTTRMAQFKNYLSISTDAIELTDIAESEKMVIKSSEGIAVGWTLKAYVWRKKLEDFHNKLDARLLIGKKFTNATLTAIIGDDTPSGSGHFSYIDNFGKAFGYTGTGIDITDFDKAVTNIYALGLPRQYSVSGAIGGILNIEDALSDKAGNAAFLKNEQGGKAQNVNLNIKTLHRGMVEFDLVDFEAMSNPEILGPDHSDRVILMPTHGKTESGRGRENYININVLDGKDGYTNGYLERMRSGTHGAYVLDEKKSKYDVTAVKGLECYGQKAHMQFKKTS